MLATRIVAHVICYLVKADSRLHLHFCPADGFLVYY